LTGWQQVILFVQMCLGSPVSRNAFSCRLLTVRKGGGFVGYGLLAKVRATPVFLSRALTALHYRYYFAKKFDHIIEAAKARALEIGETEKSPPPWTRRISTLLSRGTVLSAVEESSSSNHDEKPKKRGFMRKLKPEMIRRMDHPPQLVNPSGWISEGQSEAPKARNPELEGDAEKNGSVELERPRFTENLVSSPKALPEDAPPVSPSSPSHLAPRGLVELKSA
jgi:hypothetical protein